MNTIPEIIIASIYFISLSLCVYSWHKYREFEALGFVFPLLFFTGLYILFTIDPVDDTTRREWVRPGLISIAIVIDMFRVVYILRQRRKRK